MNKAVEQKKVAIVVLNFNGKEDTLDCLKTIKQLSNCQIAKLLLVVVDNNSNDGSVDAVRKKFPKVKIIENRENLGFAEGNNVGIRYALENSFDYILLLNNDTLVDNDFLVQLTELAEKDKKIGIVCPKIYFAPGFEFHKSRYKKSDWGKVIWFAGGKIDWQNVLSQHVGVDQVDKGQFDKKGEIEFATGCCMLVKKEVFKAVGLLDKKYFLYWEDVDFSIRATKAGFKIFYVPKAVVWHKNAGTSASGSFLHDYYLTRNRLYFGLKYACMRTKAALLKESLTLLLRGRKGQKRGILDFYKRRFGKLKND